MARSTQVKTAPCQAPGCTGTVYYKVRQPKLCKSCRNKKKPNGNSKLENRIFALLNQLFKDEYINNGYYSWLVSPKGMPLQLDRYYPDIKLAFEIQGQQHLEWTKYYHKKKTDFEYLQLCDSIKGQTCAKRGITLIHIKYNETLSRELILSKLFNSNKKLYNKLKKEHRLDTTY